MGERYKTITKETQGVLKGEYGATPSPVNSQLQERVLAGGEPITCRPADLLEPELDKLTAELKAAASEHGVILAEAEVDDVLTYALFPQIGFKFLQHRGNSSAFEPAPQATTNTGGQAETVSASEYDVTVNGRSYRVKATDGGVLAVNGRNYKVEVAPANGDTVAAQTTASGGGEVVKAPMAGHILRINVSPGQHVEPNTVVIVMEAMKMETEIRTRTGGLVASIAVKVGDTVASQDDLLTLE
jgi:oxaloacetate decarboxylase alpha subunit